MALPLLKYKQTTQNQRVLSFGSYSKESDKKELVLTEESNKNEITVKSSSANRNKQVLFH